jgi:hypothetical protein
MFDIYTGIAVVHGVLTRFFCPYPSGYVVAQYEEEGSMWSDVPEVLKCVVKTVVKTVVKYVVKYGRWHHVI